MFRGNSLSLLQQAAAASDSPTPDELVVPLPSATLYRHYRVRPRSAKRWEKIFEDKHATPDEPDDAVCHKQLYHFCNRFTFFLSTTNNIFLLCTIFFTFLAITFVNAPADALPTTGRAVSHGYASSNTRAATSATAIVNALHGLPSQISSNGTLRDDAGSRSRLRR